MSLNRKASHVFWTWVNWSMHFDLTKVWFPFSIGVSLSSDIVQSSDIHMQVWGNTIRSECMRHKKAEGLSERLNSVLNAGQMSWDWTLTSRKRQISFHTSTNNKKQSWNDNIWDFLKKVFVMCKMYHCDADAAVWSQVKNYIQSNNNSQMTKVSVTNKKNVKCIFVWKCIISLTICKGEKQTVQILHLMSNNYIDVFIYLKKSIKYVIFCLCSDAEIIWLMFPFSFVTDCSSKRGWEWN